MEKLKNIVFYFGAVLLLAVYLLVLCESKDTSRVSDEYRMFYITKELKYYLADDGLKDYVPNQLYCYKNEGNYRNQGAGWGLPEENATWIYEKDAYLYLYIDDNSKDYQFCIFVQGSYGYNNYLYVNGENQGKVDVVDGIAAIEINKSCIVEGINEFCIHTENEILPLNVKNPESNDTRTLNLYISGIELKTK